MQAQDGLSNIAAAVPNDSSHLFIVGVGASVGEIDFSEASRERLELIEDELYYTKERLSAAIQQLQTANEELQSTNEELVAANEELQSSNEELHSANQELYAVNAEHLREIAQLTELAEIVQHSDDAIFRVDLGGRIRTWNYGAVRVYGYSDSEIVGQNISRLDQNGSAGEVISRLLERLERGEHREQWEIKSRRADGSVFDGSLRISPIYSDTGIVQGVSCIARDITEQKQAEAEVRDAVQRRDTFLAMLSHELRNPLGAVLNAIEMIRLKNGSSVESLETGHQVIERQTRHAARLLDDLLDVSRITQNKIEFRKEVVDLAVVVEDVVECVSHLVHRKDQKLYVQMSAAGARVYGDGARLKQALVNLLTNASRYTLESGSIWFELATVGNEAVIRVRDSGEGISPGMLNGIFDLFVQSGSSRDQSLGGLGVGLSLSRSIIEAHGGSIVACSEGLGKGSEFTVRLPLTSEPCRERPVAQEAAFEGCKLLLVEDNEDARNMLATILRLNGFEVAEAGSGSEAIHVFIEFQPDVSVVDIGLPDKSGCEVAREIRELSFGDDTLLVALTGYGRETDREATRAAGFDAHLLKPFNPSALYDLVARRFAPAAIEIQSSGEQGGHHPDCCGAAGLLNLIPVQAVH